MTRPAFILASLALLLPGPAIEAQGRNVLDLLPTEGRTLEAGAVVLGTLDGDDWALMGDELGEAWSFRVDEGGLWRIDMASETIDAFLRLLGEGLGTGLENDDGGPGQDARICAELAPGEYGVVASSLFGDGGRFELRAARIDDPAACGEDGIAVPTFEVGLEEIPVEGTLAFRQPRTSTLSAGWSYEDRPSTVWTFDGAPGQSVLLDLEAEFDAYLVLVGPGIGEEWADDDGGCGTGSRIEATLEEGGEYRVVVSSLFGDTGEYTVRLLDPGDALPECEAGDFDYAGFDGRLEIGDTPPIGRIGIGEEVDGELGDYSDWVGGGHGDLWTLEGEAGRRIAITVRADFDPQVYLISDLFDGDLFDDDGGEELDSRLCVRLPEAGPYAILVRGFGDESVGTYRLAIEADPEPGSCLMQGRSPDGDVRPE